MLKDYQWLNLSSLTQELTSDYRRYNILHQKLIGTMNLSTKARIKMLRAQRTTGFFKNGLLPIDDTGSLKPFAKKT